MLPAITTLLLFQLGGEALTRGLALGVPGPVLGMAGLALALAASRDLRDAVAPTANGLLRHLSLLFVPAAVGVVQQLPVIAAEFVPILAALLVSTSLTIAVTALVFRSVARALGLAPEE
jgi:holin-like protein